MSDAELLALHLARIRFKHPYPSVWWELMRQVYPHLPSYTQAYVRLIRLREVVQLLSCRPRRHRLVVVDSQPIPVCRWRRRKRCACAGATEGYGTHGAVYGFKLHAFVSLKGEVLAYRLRPANEHDYRVAKAMLEHLELGSPLKIGDKAYTSAEFVTPPRVATPSLCAWRTPPKKNAKRPDARWKLHYHRLRKRVETVFAQLTQPGWALPTPSPRPFKPGVYLHCPGGKSRPHPPRPQPPTMDQPLNGVCYISTLSRPA